MTGGTRGIGEMIARGFVEAGAMVYISSRKADVGEALAEELSAIGTVYVTSRRTSHTRPSANVSRTNCIEREDSPRRPGQQRRRDVGCADGRVRRERL